MGAICNCGTQLGIPTGVGGGPWTPVSCVNGSLVVPSAVAPDVCDPAGTWGGAGLAFPGGEAAGAPIYCSTTGLRTAPAHTGLIRNREGLATPPAQSDSPLGVGAEFAGNEANVTIVNPSTSRSMALFVVVHMGMELLSGGACTDANFGINVFSGFSYSGRFQHWRGDPSNTGGINTSISLMNTDMQILGPGASITFQGRPYLTCLGGVIFAGGVRLGMGISVFGHTI